MINSKGSSYKTIVSSMRNAQRELSDSITAIRKAIKEQKAKREEILAINVDLAFAEKRVVEWVEERVGTEVRGMRHDPMKGRWMEPPQPEDFIQPPQDWRPQESDLLVTLAYYLKPELTAAIRERLVAVYTADVHSITEEDRADRLSKIDRNILDAEMSEESIIRSAERAGFKIDRRPDADPRAVLASDEVLP